MSAPWKSGVPGVSGLSVPFMALDAFFGRTSWGSVLGIEAALQQSFLVPNWRAFVTALGAPHVSVPAYVARSSNARLQAC